MPAKEIFLNTKWGKIENNNHHQREIKRVFGTDDDEDDERETIEWKRERTQKAMDGLLRASVVLLYWNWYNMRIFLEVLTSGFIFIFEL